MDDGPIVFGGITAIVVIVARHGGQLDCTGKSFTTNIWALLSHPTGILFRLGSWSLSFSLTLLLASLLSV